MDKNFISVAASEKKPALTPSLTPARRILVKPKVCGLIVLNPFDNENYCIRVIGLIHARIFRKLSKMKTLNQRAEKKPEVDVFLESFQV